MDYKYIKKCVIAKYNCNYAKATCIRVALLSLAHQALLYYASTIY